MSIYTKTIDLQKLNKAWERVKKNKPSAGVDNISYEQFEETRAGELRHLNEELKNHEYQALPVKLVTIYKGEKARTIALYSMRDKVVQQSLATELGNIFEGRFSSQTYAYRPNKSAVAAISEIEEAVKGKQYLAFLKADIRHYFDCIQWNLLKGMLQAYISEEDLIELIRENTCSRSLDEATGELMEKNAGIYQGSGIAPILSNVYLMEFDKWLSSQSEIYFVRYSDDMLILGKSRERILELLQEIKARLEFLGLELNGQKSVVGTLSDGFHFLGYYFDEKGKSIPAKAESNLFDRLEMMWLTSDNVEIEGKIRTVLEIVGGWEQYYKDKREPGSIFEFLAMVYSGGDSDEHIGILINERRKLQNIYKDAMEYLSAFWHRHGIFEMELFEYEQFCDVPEVGRKEPVLGENISELLDFYRRYLARPEQELAVEIMQGYADRKQYRQAEYWQEMSEKLRKGTEAAEVPLCRRPEEYDGMIYDVETAKKLMMLCVGREDVFAREIMDDRRGRRSETDLRPLTEQVVKQHLSGDATIDTYIQRPNATVKFIVYDVDISKRIFLQYGRDEKLLKQYMKRALDRAAAIRNEFQKMGLQANIEYSGCRGYHVWIFLSEWIPVRYAAMMHEIVGKTLEQDDAVSVECFPNKTRIKPGKYGQALKIPYGIHLKTGERSYFLDANGNPVWNVNHAMDGMAKIALSEIKKAIAVRGQTDNAREVQKHEVDMDLNAFGELDDGVFEVLRKCNLMRYLCQKSAKTGYLTHYERLTVLYVFGHIGEKGKDFVHKVMSFTLNYSYNVTENFISKDSGETGQLCET